MGAPRPASSHGPDAHKRRDVSLEAVHVPPTPEQRDAIHDALRLLATWAVRAARGQTEAKNSDLTVPPPEAMNAPRIQEMEKT